MAILMLCNFVEQVRKTAVRTVSSEPYSFEATHDVAALMSDDEMQLQQERTIWRSAADKCGRLFRMAK